MASIQLTLSGVYRHHRILSPIIDPGHNVNRLLYQVDRAARDAHFRLIRHMGDCIVCAVMDDLGDTPTEAECPTIHAMLADEIEAIAMQESMLWVLGRNDLVEQEWLDTFNAEFAP